MYDTGPGHFLSGHFPGHFSATFPPNIYPLGHFTLDFSLCVRKVAYYMYMYVSMCVYCALYVGMYVYVYACIGVDFGKFGGSPGTCPPIIENRPCIYHFLSPFAPPIFWFALPIFLTSLRQCMHVCIYECREICNLC